MGKNQALGGIVQKHAKHSAHNHQNYYHYNFHPVYPRPIGYRNHKFNDMILWHGIQKKKNRGTATRWELIS
jgi:hypothetical protein